MAAALPAINPGGGAMGSGSPTIQQHHIPSPPPKGSAGSARLSQLGGSIKRRSQSKKDRQLEQRRIQLRAQQPDLSRQQTAGYRNSFKHNLFLDMLQQGFHKSFQELFALIRQQNLLREQAGPESTLWNQMQLENETDKLNTLATLLTQAESAYRIDDYNTVYKCQYELARYFQGTGDKWLTDHFFASCLATTASVKDDGGKTAAEGHCNVGLAQEESGQHFEAAENFELFYDLAKDKSDWELEAGRPMHIEACMNLARIYTTVAESYERDGDLEQYLTFLQKAYDKAKESCERKLEGEASFKLGVAYEKNGDSDTALKYLNKYLDTCRALDDNDGTGKACEAIAKSYESQGKVEESIKYLEMFVDTAEKSKNDKAISRACSDLGAMFNSLGRYDQAVEYFNKSYNISRAMNDTETISSSRVLFGVAAAHKMLGNLKTHIELSTRPCLERLIEWKDNRGDEFDKPIPEPNEEDLYDDVEAPEEEGEEEKKEEADTKEEADDEKKEENEVEEQEDKTGEQEQDEQTED